MELQDTSPPPDPLDVEIASLQEELASLRKTIKIECSTILSSAAFQARRSHSKHPPTSSSSSSTTITSSSSSSALKSARQLSKPTPAVSVASTSSTSIPTSTPPASRTPTIASLSALHAAHVQQGTYRIASSITAFHVRDPDPHAVDGARVLALRFEVMARGRFLTPYYVMLNRPYSDPNSNSKSNARANFLRVHRHTVPPAVPLAGLAGRYLPAPGRAPDNDNDTDNDTVNDKDAHTADNNRDGNATDPDRRRPRPRLYQDLDTFARKLRKEILRYHNRLGASADLKRSLAAAHARRAPTDDNDDNDDNDDQVESESENENENENENGHANDSDPVDVGIADMQAKQIRLTWPASDRNGRIVMDDDGRLVKAVILGPQGRDWDAARELFGDSQHIHDVINMLEE